MIKKALKRFLRIDEIRLLLSFNREYRYDKSFFKRHFSHSKTRTREKDGYNMLLISHSLEKGMSTKTPRPFGALKVSELMKLIKEYEQYDDYSNDFAFINAVNSLRSYTDFYSEKNWVDMKEYKDAKQFLLKYNSIIRLDVGSFTLHKTDFEKDASIDYRRFLSSRHSVREFKKEKLSKQDIDDAVEMAILSPSACNRQMCKVYYVSDKAKTDKIIRIAQGFGGFEKDTINLFIITFDVSANYFVGERNQGWFNAGLFSMNFVNALHSLGIGSCFCQFGNKSSEEEYIKTIVGISESERIAVLISAGYYCDICRVPHSPRKTLSEIFRIV